MIEGVKIEIGTAELREHLLERQRYHENQVAALQNAAQMLTNTLSKSLAFRYEDPASISRHREQATFFAFLADHLVENETYRLSLRDLTDLEYTDQHFLNLL